MAAYKRIMIATDFSEGSIKAADKAKMIAQINGAELYLVHVVAYTPMVYGAGDFVMPMTADVEMALQKSALEALEQERERLGLSPEQGLLQTGDTTESLVQLVEEKQIDLLILGSHEHHGLGFLLSSTSNSVVHEMPCDILAVRI